jgi:hypothetical protein
VEFVLNLLPKEHLILSGFRDWVQYSGVGYNVFDADANVSSRTP